MSYPRPLHVLVVEDDSRSKELYEELFRQLAKNYDFASVRYAFSVSDAETELARDQPLHLILSDLCLPDQPNRPAPNGSIDNGLRILDGCLVRDSFPIPAVLVVS